MTFKECLARAQIACRMGEYGLAKRLLERHLEKEGGDPVICNLLGSIYEREGNYEKAIGLFQRAIAERKENIEAYNNLGVAYKNRGETEKALAAFFKVLEMNARRADVHYNLGNLYKGINLFKNAVEYYKKAIEFDPGYVLAYNNLGTVLEKMGQYDNALAVYHKGLQIDAKNARLHYNAALIYLKKNRWKEAESELRSAIKNKSGFNAAKNHLAMILKQRHEYEQALALYREILKTEPQNAEVYNNMGAILGEQHVFDRARELYQTAVRINPHYSKARFNLALLDAETGAPDEALRGFRQLIEDDPDHLDARLQIGMLLFEQGRLEEAEKHFRKLIHNEKASAEALRSLGRIHLKRREIGPAMRIDEQIKIIDEHNFDFNLDLAFYFQEQREYGKAEEQIRRFLSQHPRHTPARVLLADILLAQNKKDEAEEALAHADRDPEILFMLAKVYKAKKEQNRALSVLNEIIAHQGAGDETTGVKNLSETIELYEETISEFEEQFKEQWDKNLKKYKELESPPENKEFFAGDAVLVERAFPVERDTLPIINIGGREPVFVVKEEEKILRIEEQEEAIHNETEDVVEIQEEGVPTLMSLLDGEELYEESPRLARARNRPPKIKRVRSEPKEVIGEAGIDESVDEVAGETTGGSLRLTPMVKESKISTGVNQATLDTLAGIMKKSIASLSDAVKNSLLANENLSRQVIPPSPSPPPVIMFTQPLVTNADSTKIEIPTVTEEDAPPDRKEDTPSIEGEEALSTETQARPEEETGETEIRLEDVPEDLGEDEAEREEQSLNLREKLKSYVNDVRKNLLETEEKSEAPGAEKPSRLLDYLANMTNYLPKESGFQALENEMRIRMELLRGRLAGKKGLFRHIEDTFPYPGSGGEEILTNEGLASTFAFIKDLSGFMPSHTLRELIRKKIDVILGKIRGLSGK